jgi:hypothetical protein
MSSLIIITQNLENIINQIENNNVEISSHDSNARVARTGAAAAYLLTNNSKNQTTRTLGQVAAVGGLVYGSNQKNKSNELKDKNLQSINNAVSLICNNSLNSFRSENNIQNKSNFLSKVLSISSYLDSFVLNNCNSINSKNIIFLSGQNLLMSLENHDIFFLKLKLNTFLNGIDSSICKNNFINQYRQSNRSIDKNKLKNEGILILAIIISCLFIGFIILQNSQSSFGTFLILAAPIIYLIHTFFPFLKESKKLKSNSKYFTNINF